MPDETLDTLSREDLLQTVKDYRDEINDLKFQLEVANGKIKLLTQDKYGSKSEKGICPEQISLFDEVDDLAIQAADEEEKEKKREASGKKRKAKKMAMNELPDNLKVNPIYHDIDDQTKQKYGDKLVKIGETRHRQLIRIPAHYEINEHITYKYAVKGHPELGVFSAPDDTDFPFPKSPVSAELLAHLMVQKYQYGVPINRLIQGMESEGIHFKSQTIAKWMIDSAEKHIQPIYQRMREYLLEEEILHGDETYFIVFTAKKKDPEYKRKKKRTYIWTFCTSAHADKDIVMYYYDDDGGRHGDVAAAFLNGFKGYLITDDYDGYNKVKGITRCLCNIHARRHMLNLYKKGIKNAIVMNSLEIYNEIFRIDAEIREKHGKSYEDIRKERENRIRPLFDLLFVYLETSEPYVMLKSETHEAMMYILNGKEELVNFLQDGRLESTNNRCERNVKPIIMNRKNSLFFGSPKGATGSCIMISIVQTARRNQLKTEEYMTYLIKKMSKTPNATREELDEMMPWSAKMQEQFGIKKEENQRQDEQK